MATDSALQHAKRPANPLAGPYGHPFHAMVVTVPIGTWVAAVIFDLVALVGDDPEAFTIGARWLLGIGVLAAIVAAVLGLMDWTRIAPGTKAKKLANIHMILNLGAIVIFGVDWILHLGGDEPTVAGFVLGLVGLLGIAISGFLGGELSYRYGVRVADEGTQAEGYVGASRR